MKRKVLIIDTSVLCVWLGVPGKSTCGSKTDKWDYKRLKDLFTHEHKAGTTMVLPLAALVETGNHIANCTGDRYLLACSLVDLIKKSLDEETPWAAFRHQADLWSDDIMRKLVEEWPEKAKEKVSVADLSIRNVAVYFQRAGVNVEILTGDNGLKALEPAPGTPIPRRRR